MSKKDLSTVNNRLEEVGITQDCFIDVKDGEKASLDHTRHSSDGVSGNYGIYATAKDDLVILDIDDYGGLDNREGLEALDELPDTFEQESPHGGTHRFFAIDITKDGRLATAALEDKFGKANLKPSWGEVRSKNQYVVGAGSQLDGCGKDWCDSCETEEGGNYTIKHDRPIARIEADDLISVLKQDPDLTEIDKERRPQRTKTESIDLDIGIYDVISRAYEPGQRAAHPTHGSDTGSNFKVDEDGDTWRCWRHSTTGNALHLLGMEEGLLKCGEWDSRQISSSKWGEIFEAARERGLDVGEPPKRIDSTSKFDPKEVERGEAILDAQTDPESPVGALQFNNGGYGIPWQKNENGEVIQGVDQITNFTMKTVSILNTEESETSEFVIEINPNHPTDDPYNVRVEPSVFNSVDAFTGEVVTGRTTWFDPSNRKKIPRSTILRYLRETVAAQPAPRRTGQSYIGLSSDGTEFVTPVGSLTKAGWAEDPNFEFYSKGGEGHTSGPIEQKWEIDAEQNLDVEDSEVAEICELLAKSRTPERGIPMLGWFYAAPIKAHIHKWEREFPILAPHGDTGTGKTSIIETYMQAFGGTGEPLSSTDTKFTKEKHLAESRGFPIWIDEYKPTEMSESYRNHLHQRLKEVTKERTMPKGRPDMGMTMLHMRAPVVLSGEQKVSDPAVRRRSILTNLTREPTRDGSDCHVAFKNLTGGSYQDKNGDQQHTEGKDLRKHAIAYYGWILSHGEEKLRAWWRQALQRTKELLKTHGITLEASEERAIQTIIFGASLHQEFAKTHGASIQNLPTEVEVENACLHVIENIGKDGQRREHADEFLEILSLAATESKLKHGVHHRVLHSQKHGVEALAIHMPSCYTVVKRFLRDSNLEDQYQVLSKDDYSNSFRNKAKNGSGYVLGTNVRTKGVDNGGKTIQFDHEEISDKLGGDFNIDVFRPDSDTIGSSGDLVSAATPIADLELKRGKKPFRNLTVKVRTFEDGWKGGPEKSGVLIDKTGAIDVIDWHGSSASKQIEEGDCYLIRKARLVTNQDGALQVELVDKLTTVKKIQQGAGHTGSSEIGEDQESLVEPESTGTKTAADGGTTTESTIPEDAIGPLASAQRARHLLEELGYGMRRDKLIYQLTEREDLTPTEATKAVDEAKKRGLLIDTDGKLNPS